MHNTLGDRERLPIQYNTKGTCKHGAERALTLSERGILMATATMHCVPCVFTLLGESYTITMVMPGHVFTHSHIC